MTDKPDIAAAVEPPTILTALDHERMLFDLLAVIHRDGGHRRSEVGTEQAWTEAMMLVPTHFTALEALPVMREALEAVIASRDAHCFEREQFKSGGSYGDYWSPSTSMVESSAIAKARAALASLPKEMG